MKGSGGDNSSFRVGPFRFVGSINIGAKRDAAVAVQRPQRSKRNFLECWQGSDRSCELFYTKSFGRL